LGAFIINNDQTNASHQNAHFQHLSWHKFKDIWRKLTLHYI
jgi:hypothetical protein